LLTGIANTLVKFSAISPNTLAKYRHAMDNAIERAEQLRPVFDELAGLSARKIAAVLNERKVVTPTGGVWHAATVIRVQKRLGLT
jgi:hypothetical protein